MVKTVRSRLAMLGASIAFVLGAPRAHALPPPSIAPDSVAQIFGPGAVLTTGRLHMKVTNIGLLGNPFPLLSSDPSGQWPNASGVEYLNHIGLVVAATNPLEPFPFNFHHRASDLTEWRPVLDDPADHIYQTSAGALHGVRFVNDDGDIDPLHGEPRIDEEFLDGKDNDGDGLIDEDCGAIGDQEFTCSMRDDTPESIVMNSDGPHIPLGLECRQSAWCWSLPQLSDFDVVDYQIVNRSGHTLDSLYIGWEVDMGAGSASDPLSHLDDRDLPGYPHGEFLNTLAPSDPRRQTYHSPLVNVPPGQPLCQSVPMRANGFSVADDDGDSGRTPGVATFLLVDHTTDPIGFRAPVKVGFRAFRSYRAGTPWASGGGPTTDSLRYIFMSGNEGVDGNGFVNAPAGSVNGDYVQYCSVGPFLQVPNGGSVHATIAFLVQNGSFAADSGYDTDLAAFLANQLSRNELVSRYPALAGALELMATRDGFYEHRAGIPVPDFHGRETSLIADPGQQYTVFEECGDASRYILVTDRQRYWFDFDCDYCTGPWDYSTQQGYFHHTWSPESTPATDVPRDELAAASLRPTIAPNPARGESRIAFRTRTRGPLEVSIVDVTGRTVRRLAHGTGEAGSHEVTWDGRDDAGHTVAAGVYLCTIRSGTDRQVARLAVVR